MSYFKEKSNLNLKFIKQQINFSFNELNKLVKSNYNLIEFQSIYLIIWFISSILLLFSNRFITIELGFNKILTLNFFQSFFTLIFIKILLLLIYYFNNNNNNIKSNLSWKNYLNKILPIGLSFSISIISSSVAVNYLSLMILQLIPCTAPILTEISRKLLSIKSPTLNTGGGGERGGGRKWFTIILTSLSLFGAIAGGLKFGAFDTELTSREKFGIHYTIEVNQVKLLSQQFSFALILLIIGVLAEVIGSVLLEKIIRNSTTSSSSYTSTSTSKSTSTSTSTNNSTNSISDKIRPLELLSHYIPIITLILGISSIILEPGAIQQLFKLSPLALMGSSLSSISVFILIPYVIQTSNSTTLALAIGIKNVFCTFLACIIFSIGVGYYHAFGFFLALVGFSNYLGSHSDGSLIVYEGLNQDSPGPMKEKELARLKDEEENDPEVSTSSSTTGVDSTSKTIRPKSTSSQSLFTIVMILIILIVITVTDRKPHTTYLPSQPKYQTLINRTKIATILEPRNLPHLGPLILHFLSVLPDDWPMTIWCSNENLSVLKHNPSLLRQINNGRLNLTLLPHSIDLHNGEYLTRFLTKPWFWEQFNKEAEWMLFFQSDSILCSRSNQSIEDWVGYDWVGAPWNDNSPEGSFGGNGGLSMRKISSMQRITRENIRENGDRPEDVYFSEALGKIKETKWPIKHQGYFSVEEQHATMVDWAWAPFGMHSGGKGHTQGMWQDVGRLSRLMEWCPEVNLFYSSITQLSIFQDPI